MLQRARGWLAVAVLGLATFVLVHQLVFRYTYGDAMDAALARTGHGTGWTLTEIASAVLAIAFATAAAIELRRLSQRSTNYRASGLAWMDEPVRTLVRPFFGWWLLLAVTAAILFTLSENVEHALIGAPLPGLGVFGGAEYAGTLPILMAVSCCVAGLRAIYGWRRSVLIARLRPARPRLGDPDMPRPVARPRGEDRRPSTYIGAGSGKRAPPRPAIA